jgi:hypothetical protein
MKKFASLIAAAMLLLSTGSFAQEAQSTQVKHKRVETKTVTPAVTAEATAVAPVERAMKKDGTPDKRYKENKHLKKDGTPDKRYKSNKAADVTSTKAIAK